MGDRPAVDLMVFDMAGTTIEDRGQVGEAFLAALRGQQIAVTAEALLPWRGAAKHQALQALVEAQYGPDDPKNAVRVEAAYADFRAELERRYAQDGVSAIAGAEETFAWLHAQGIRVALTTGFYRKVTDLILQATGWQPDLVDAAICSDDVPQGRPAPYMIFRAMEATGATDVRRVVKVGDTVLDLQAGVNAGLRAVVGVLTGSQTREQLSSVAGAFLIPSVAELPRLLQRELGQTQ
jgi:phosphonatase-like hydrolase